MAENKEEESKNCHFVLGCTPGIPVIDRTVVDNLSEYAKIIDVGNGTVDLEGINLAQERKIEILSPSSFAGYAGMIENWLLQRRLFGRNKRKLFENNSLIIPGFFGKRGDVIVDDVDNPARVMGICDGKGNILSKENSQPIFMDFLAQIKDPKIAFQIKALYDRM